MIDSQPLLLAACKQVVPMAQTLMDEQAKTRATDWGLVNKCLVDVADAIAKATPEGVL